MDSKFPTLKNQRDNDNNNALTLAGYYADRKTIKFLLEELKMNVYEKGQNGRNCFLQAAIGDKYEILRYLSTNYPKVKNGRDYRGNNGLHLAAIFADTRTVKLLVEEIRMNMKITGKLGGNCLLLAAEAGQLKTVKYLDSINPNLKWQQNDEGQNALYKAWRKKRTHVVKFLRKSMRG